METISEAPYLPARPRVSRFLTSEALTGYFLISPAVFLMLVLLAYPFVLAVSISMTDRVLGEPGKFIWFRNFYKLLQDSLFRQTVWNSFVYTVSTVFLKMFLGVILALLLNQEIRCRNLVRGAILLPWIVPTSLSVLTWLWMFDSLFSVGCERDVAAGRGVRGGLRDGEQRVELRLRQRDGARERERIVPQTRRFAASPSRAVRRAQSGARGE